MTGKFKKADFGIKIGMICCVATILFFIFLSLAAGFDKETLPDAILIISIMATIGAFFLWYICQEKKRSITIDENGNIEAYYIRKYSCKIEDITYIIYRNDCLTITANEKTFSVMGLENGAELYFYIRKKKKIFSDESETVDSLIFQRDKLRKEWKKGFIVTVFLLSLIFVYIFAVVFLTDEKELHEFTKTDTIVGIVALITGIITYILALKTGLKANKKINKVHQLDNNILEKIILTTPLPSENAVLVLASFDFTLRVTVFGFPNSDEVYMTLEEITAPYTLTLVSTTDIYNDIEQLELENDNYLIDITDKFI